MSTSKFGPASVTLLILSVTLLIASAYYAYLTGCTADLKTGSLGNPVEALRQSDIFFKCFIAGLICGSLSIWFARGVDLAIRLGLAIGFFVLAGFAFWVLAFFLESYGLQQCFAAA